MSLTTINPQDDGGSPPPAPTPVQPQAEVKATAYQLFYRDLETYMKHRPHSMFSKAQCLALFNTYERGLVEMQDIRGQLSQNSPASLEDGEV